MPDDRRPPIPTRLRAMGAVLAALAALAGGTVLSACGGGGDTTSSTGQAQKEIEAGATKAEEGVKEGAEFVIPTMK